MASVNLSNLSKRFGKVEIIHNIDLDIKDGEFVVFVGPSGCGKSTLLRMIAGLEDISAGSLMIDGKIANDLPASKRDVAMVFQSYAIYPHMTVRDNISFGMKVRGIPSKEIEAKVREAAEILQLDELLDRLPKELSGGQRQRVAIGRAMVRDPGVFLFDEPLSNLDAELRVHMRAEVSQLHQRLANTMIYVTHDQIEAMTLADRIVVLRKGQIEQIGTPKELYERPANVFCAQFIGSPKMNILPAELIADAPNDVVHVGIRPEHLKLADDQGRLSGTVTAREYTGSSALIHVKLPSGQTVLLVTNGSETGATGDSVLLNFEMEDLHQFDQSGNAISQS